MRTHTRARRRRGAAAAARPRVLFDDDGGRRAAQLAEILKQGENAPVPVEEQIITLHALKQGFFEGASPADVNPRIARIMDHLRSSYSHLLDTLLAEKTISPDLEKGINEQLTRVRNTYT